MSRWPPPAPLELPAVPFDRLTRAQALVYHDAYVAGMPARLTRLREWVPANGGPAASKLDAGPDSLDLLWDWYIAGAHRLEPRWSPDDADLPVWLRHLPPAPGGLFACSAEMARDIDLLAAYTGEAILRTYPGARWAFAELPARRRYIWQHRTVIDWQGRHINPLSQAGGMVLRTLVNQYQRQGTESFRRVHDEWADALAADALAEGGGPAG